LDKKEGVLLPMMTEDEAKGYFELKEHMMRKWSEPVSFVFSGPAKYPQE
jgi:hypothetical protein